MGCPPAHTAVQDADAMYKTIFFSHARVCSLIRETAVSPMVVGYSIESVQFRGRFLRLDGGGENKASPGGVVNCQASVGDYEKFRFHSDTNNIVTIESTSFPNVFLRLDGRDVSKEFDPAGAGRVTAQFAAGELEKFRIRSIEFNIPGELHYGIESVAFPNVWLRMDAGGITAYEHNGGGTVNAQFGPPSGEGSYEAFLLNAVSDVAEDWVYIP